MTVEYVVKYGSISVKTCNKNLAVKLAKKTNGAIYKSIKKNDTKGIDVKA